MLKSALSYRKAYNTCKIKINIIIIKGFNDSIKTIREIANYLDVYKKNIIIKISFLNPTITSLGKNMYSPTRKKMNQINSFFIDKNFDSYIFGSDENTNMGCGQLVHVFNETKYD